MQCKYSAQCEMHVCTLTRLSNAQEQQTSGGQSGQSRAQQIEHPSYNYLRMSRDVRQVFSRALFLV